MSTISELTSSIKTFSNQFIVESCFQLGRVTNFMCVLVYARYSMLREYIVMVSNTLILMINDRYIIRDIASVMIIL
jgi:hypothetical protein